MTSPKKRKPTDAELVILNVLWQQGWSLVRQVHEAVQDQYAWGYTTVLKYLQIMEKKGLVRVDKSSRAHRYYATWSRKEMGRYLVDDLIHHVFEGSRESMLSVLFNEKHLRPGQFEELRKQLLELRERS